MHLGFLNLGTNRAATRGGRGLCSSCVWRGAGDFQDVDEKTIQVALSFLGTDPAVPRVVKLHQGELRVHEGGAPCLRFVLSRIR